MSVTTLHLHGQPTMNISAPGHFALSRLDPLQKIFDKFFSSIPQIVRGHVVAVISELIGTTAFLFFAFSAAEVALISGNDNNGDKIDYTTKSIKTEQLLYISFGAGISLVVTAWTFFRISGALFDPAVSIAMFLVGGISFARCILLSIAQCAGAIAASALVYALYDGGLHTGTTLKPGVSVAQGCICEMICTCQLVFTVLMLAAEKHEGTFLAPLGIGLSVFIGEMTGVFWTGGSMNPARSLGPAIINRDFPGYHWIYWVGPISGAILAALIYKLIKALEYETAQLDPSELLAKSIEDTEKGHTEPCECMCFKANKGQAMMGGGGLSPGVTQVQSAEQDRKSSSLVPVKSTRNGSSMKSGNSGESENGQEKVPSVVVAPAADDDFMQEMHAD
ncbi:Aquaporin-5 [Clarireedia jacksonii]